MSKASSEKLLNKLWEELNRSDARKQLQTSKHFIILRTANLTKAFTDAYNRVRKRDPYLPILEASVFHDAATSAIQAMRTHLAKSSTGAYETKQSKEALDKENYIAYVTKKNGYGPLNYLKDEAVKSINKALMAKGFAPLEKGRVERGEEIKQQGYFKAGIEFHHKDTTVGAAQLAQSLAFLSKSNYFKGFAQSAEIKDLRDIFGKFDLDFIATQKDLSVRIRSNINIKGIIGSYIDNTSGSEKNDWSKIRPSLEKSLRQWAEKQNWWKHKGSRSLEENTLDAVGYSVVKILTKSKRVSKINSSKKPKNQKSTAQISKPKTSIKGKGGNKQAISAPRAQKGVSSTPLYLIGVMNEQLPRVIQKNMDAPALENRTGRFASSVRVTDIVMTAGGFPSIGYTYMKGPYQTFEPGFRQGSVERDPRRLIDKSMREIAAQYAIGRFYTRRV